MICTKVRDGAKRIVRLKEGEARGQHVVIVDDLVQSGSTLLECGKLLKAQVIMSRDSSKERIQIPFRLPTISKLNHVRTRERSTKMWQG